MIQVAPHLGIKLSTYRIAAPSDIEKGCFAMKQKGLHVLVGGGRAVQQAQKLGMHGILHTSSPDGILQVLGEAEHLFNAILARGLKTPVPSLLNSLKECVISLTPREKSWLTSFPPKKCLLWKTSMKAS
jgi:hypothetical protein